MSSLLPGAIRSTLPSLTATAARDASSSSPRLSQRRTSTTSARKDGITARRRDRGPGGQRYFSSPRSQPPLHPAADPSADPLTSVASLQRQLQLHTSTLLSAPSTQPLLTDPSLSAAAAAQAAHDAQSLYRVVAGLTTFAARDPDPRAVDGGRLLGLRLEVAARGRFLRPYYVLLNRPYAGSGGGGRSLRVHRHTVPPAVPLAGLAARYLPAPAAVGGEEEALDGGARRQQDLAGFARALRRDVARYHARLGAVADLRRAAGLEGTGTARAGGKRRERRPGDVVHVAAADAEVRQVELGWADGRTGRLVLGDDGVVRKVVVFGERGRDRAAARALLAGGDRVEDVVRAVAAAST